MEFKGWVTDYSKSSIQGITDDEVATLVSGLQRMAPQQAHNWIDLDQTRKEQGTWPTKTMVSVWFKNETNLVTMIDLLKGMKEELEKAAYKIHGQNVKARPEVSPQRKPLAEAHALFFKGLKEMKGDESKVRTFMETLNFLLRGERNRSQIYREGQGRAEEGWIVNLPVVSAICTDFSDALFETMVKYI